MNWISVKDRLIKLSEYDPTTECWNWVGALKGHHKLKRYGHLIIGSRKDKSRHSISAHRASFLEFKGEIPNGLWVLHSCDNPSCINPEHLFLGNRQANVNDRETKKRNKIFSGEDHGNAQHSLSQILEIKRMYSLGFTMRFLAHKFNYKNHKSIYEIVHGKTWKSLTTPPEQPQNAPASTPNPPSQET